MKAIFIYLSDFLVLTSAAVISPLDLTNTSGLVSNVANRPTVGTPDRRFKIDVSFHAPKIPLISTLQNTVEFLEILGLKDFSGSMEGVAWKLNDYPEVGMVISPSTQREYIYLPFVIWGLSQGVAHMIHLNRFQAVTFTLSCTYSPFCSPPIQMNRMLKPRDILRKQGLFAVSRPILQLILYFSFDKEL